MQNNGSNDDQEAQRRLISRLAVRLPWIVVIVTLLAALVTLIEIAFGIG